eukprot:s3399_g7.t2
MRDALKPNACIACFPRHRLCKCCCGPSDEYRETADVFASSDFKETTRSDAEKPGASPSEEHWLQRWGSLDPPGSISGSVSAVTGQDGETADAESENHCFQVETLWRPEWCHQCDAFLAGLWEQGCRCTYCRKLVCHSCAEVQALCVERKMRIAANNEAKLRSRIHELEALLASRGGMGMAVSSRVRSRDASPHRETQESWTSLSSIKHLHGLQGKYLADAMQVPDVELQDYLYSKPLFSANLPMSLPEVQAILLRPSFLESVFRADVGAFDIIGSKWDKASHEPHTCIRGFKYKVPIPDDVPYAVRAVLTLPPHATCKAFSRLKANEREVVLTLQFISEGVPFSENVRVQVTDAILPAQVHGQGLILRRWAVVMWMKEFPFTLRFLKNIVVSQVMDRSRKTAQILVDQLLLAREMESMKRSPTFLVGTVQQKDILGEFQKREQHYTEEYSKNKPLPLSDSSNIAVFTIKYQDADATLTSPMLLGVCDGVSQLEEQDVPRMSQQTRLSAAFLALQEFQMDPSLLPNELLRTCEELAMLQLMPDTNIAPQDQYRGPISLLKEAYQETTSYGSTTVLLAALDNSTRIHGKLHPMIAVLSIGDCELLMLRRTNGRQSELEAVFHTEMQRIDYNVQTPLQLARVDERIDEDRTLRTALAMDSHNPMPLLLCCHLSAACSHFVQQVLMIADAAKQALWNAFCCSLSAQVARGNHLQQQGRSQLKDRCLLCQLEEQVVGRALSHPFTAFTPRTYSMLKGFAFKILAPKDITGVLNMIGVHPAVAADNIDRPSADNAMAFFNALAEKLLLSGAVDQCDSEATSEALTSGLQQDSQQVKAQMPAVTPHPEIYDEAMDFLTIFKLSRQLAMINLVDDFNFKDFWDPVPKRFRALLRHVAAQTWGWHSVDLSVSDLAD